MEDATHIAIIHMTSSIRQEGIEIAFRLVPRLCLGMHYREALPRRSISRFCRIRIKAWPMRFTFARQLRGRASRYCVPHAERGSENSFAIRTGESV